MKQKRLWKRQTGSRETAPGKRRTSLIFALLFLAFLGIFDYPFIARIYNQYRQDAASVAYEDTEAALSPDKNEKMLAAARSYNERLASGTGMEITMSSVFDETDLTEKNEEESQADKPSVISVEQMLHEEYESLLNTDGAGTMGRIEIPKIRVDILIRHGTSEEVLQKGAGHLEGSSLPVGGESTHVCLSAHRGLTDKEFFTNLDELEEGDLFFLHILGETLCYRVGDIRTILPKVTDRLTIRTGEDLVTLITCTPYGINTHRLCVEGYRIPYTEEVKEEAQSQADSFRIQIFLQDYGWIFVTLLLLVTLGIMLWRYNKKK